MYERTDVLTSERMGVQTYEQMTEWTYEQMDVKPYGRMTGIIAVWMSYWFAIHMIVRLTYHPTEISVGCDKNGRIMAVFGRMDFNYFFGIVLFFHSFADSVKRYFCRGWLGWSGYSRSMAPSSNAGLI